MIDCPRCFWLQIVKGVKRPSGPFPSLPSGMDMILKKHFDRFMGMGKLPPELKEEDSVKGCSLFNDKESLSVWRNNRKGLEYVDPKSGILLHGAIDNLLVKGRNLIVLDYKTRGFPLKEDTHEHYMTQMDLYNFLLRKNGFGTEDYSLLLFYYPKEVLETGDVVFDTKIVKVKSDPSRGERIFLKAVSIVQMGEPPEASEGCEFCNWESNKRV